MATYTVEKLRSLWAQGEMTVEQLTEEVAALKKAVHTLQQERKR